MSARQSALSVKGGAYKLRTPPGGTSASGSGGRKSGTRAEDERLQPAADFRFPIADLRSASQGGGSPTPCQGQDFSILKRKSAIDSFQAPIPKNVNNEG